MARTRVQYTQAHLTRALRAMKQVFGTASVIFETDGRVRVLPVDGVPSVDGTRMMDRTAVDLGPWLPEPRRQIGASELKNLLAQFPQRRREDILQLPDLPFHRRESDALEHLSRRGVGVSVRLNTIRQCGAKTAENLYIRGYVELGYAEDEPGRIETIAITQVGAQAIAPPGKKLNAAERPLSIRL